LLVFGVQRALTSDSPTGDYATMNYAQRLLGLVQLLNMSIATVAATDLARHFSTGGLPALTRRAISHLEALSFLLAPATVLLLAFSPILVDLAFHRGDFSEHAAVETALVLRVLAWALLPGGLCMMLQLVFTSAARPVLVLVVSVPMVLAVWGVTIALKPVLGPTLLAAGFLSGIVVMLVVSFFVTASVIGSRAVLEYLNYLCRLIARVAVAVAAASLVAVAALGPRNAAAWLVDRPSAGVTIAASTVFLVVFVMLSRIGRDAGFDRLLVTVSSLLNRQRTS
jgi:peptidoglycan biosynthesis protein MviN/MurJ (putative lipid II flippase)